jgi:DNA helicase II / ATP-dependent DNA helicase PcrA
MVVSERKLVPDEQQAEAISHVKGPMLVVAGAGTGKTTVLTRRIARLIEDGHAQPGQVLALTYTRNAAGEMQERAAQELGRAKVSDLKARTFHDYCFDLLKRHDRGFGVLDEKDLWVYLRRRIRDLQLKYFVRAANVGQFLEDLLDFQRRCQDELVTPAQYKAYVDRLERGELLLPRVSSSKDASELPDEEVLGRCHEIARVYKMVEDWLQAGNLGTFGHMITKALDLLEREPEILKQEREKARFILVDEFQDSNFAQIRVLNLLAGEERNLFAVGDPDQAIFRFRGASSGAFDMFVRFFPEVKIVRLRQNRRSLTPILQCAHEVINENPPIFAAKSAAALQNRREPLVSWREQVAAAAGRPLTAAPVEIALGVAELEAADVASTIAVQKRKLRCPWRSSAVLYRQHSNRDLIVRELTERNIPFSVEGMDVLDTPQVRDLLSCIAAVVAPSDSANLFRIAAFPEFALDPAAVRAAIRAEERATPLVEVLKKVPNGTKVLDRLYEVRGEIAKGKLKSLAAAKLIVRRFGLDSESPALKADLSFIGNWQEKPVTETGLLGEFVEYMKYFREAGGVVPMESQAERDAVLLMSAHTAKGLEFDHVSILRAQTNSFPVNYREPLVEFPAELRHPDSVAAGENKEIHKQEERRLFYVAMTRARDTLTMYAARGRGSKDPTPPGFLRPLLHHHGLKRYLRERSAQAVQEDLFAAAADVAKESPTAVSRWLELPPTKTGQLLLSATSVDSYRTCPLRFKLERDWKIPGDMPAAVLYGAAMHTALRHYYDARRAGRPVAAGDVIRLFQDEFGKAVIEDPYQRELYEKQGVNQITEFVTAAEAGPAPEVLHTEESFRVDLGVAVLVGRIDRVDRVETDRVVIVDYKTGKPQTQEDADDSLQLSIYAMAAREKWGYKVDRLVFHNLDGNIPVETRRDEFALAETKATIEDVAAKIAEEKFPANPRFHCNWCGYRNICPAREKNLYLTKKNGGEPSN